MARLLISLGLAVAVFPLQAARGTREIGRGPVFSVIEIVFRGPVQDARRCPARDIEFWILFEHESGNIQHKICGFWDGDGKGGSTGDVFKVRFNPMRAGKWKLREVYSSAPELKGQRQTDYITALPSNLHGFWFVDPESAGRRWYQRSDGTHPYIIGNTHYSFLSGFKSDAQPSENDLVADIMRNAAYFKKLRFGLSGDHYPHPVEKPFLDSDGHPTDWGDFSHRPNPRWFHTRVDRAVEAAFRHDLIADLILAGPDREESRSTLRSGENGGDPTPFLRYIAARYGSYPNVWICLSNEWDIRKPIYPENEIARFGAILRKFLPYPTPLSVHASSRPLWSAQFDLLPEWHDHHIIQRKIRSLTEAADVLASVWENRGGKGPRRMPTINDELSYQGEGDKHSEEDTIESHLGAFLGGGYGTTGWKTGNKTGHYFWGRFDASEHTAADNLQWLRQIIDARVTFWRMSPDLGLFENLDPGFRGMAWAGQEYVLGTNKAHTGITARLPEGKWSVWQHDIVAKESKELARSVSGQFVFDAPHSRAVLFHFKKH